MILQTQMKKRKNKLLIFVGVICSVILLSCLSMFLYHQFMIHQSNKTYSPVGQYIEVGDHRLHYYAMGESNGLPTVILESGSGTPSSYADWRFVMPELAKRTRVITYDRAGYGWSDQANTARTSEHT